MIIRDLWSLAHPDAPMAVSYGSKAMCEEWRERDPLRRPPETYVVEPVPHCTCCGAMHGSLTTWENGATRCAKHHGRNPCAIEGCGRTRPAAVYTSGTLKGYPYHADDQSLCAEHWRRFVPPRSRLRRAYHAFFRQAKRHGWGYKGREGRSARLDWRFHRFWDALVRQARRQAQGGHINKAEIDQLFGW